jgi:hypothetical protein
MDRRDIPGICTAGAALGVTPARAAVTDTAVVSELKRYCCQQVQC